jgi:hypothetical protein
MHSGGGLQHPDSPLLSRAEAALAALSAAELRLRAAQAEWAAAAADADVCAAADLTVGMKTGPWLSHTHHQSKRQERRRVRIARELARFEDFAAALAVGRIGWEHCEVLESKVSNRNRNALRCVQDQLIEWATAMDFELWANHLDQLARLSDPDGSPPPPIDERLTLTDVGDESALRGTFGRLNAELIRTSLDAECDRLFRQATRDAEADPWLLVPDRAQLRAQALLNLLQRANGADPAAAPPHPEAVVVLHPPSNDNEGWSAASLDGRPLPTDAIDQLVTASTPIQVARFDHWGTLVSLSTKQRLATAAIRRAVAVRDGGCVFPSCDAPPSWADIHHIVPWHEGGATDIENLVSLCRHHHGVVHRSGWRQQVDPGGHLWFISPLGRRLAATNARTRGQPVPGPAPPELGALE